MKNIRLFDTKAEYNAATLDYPNVAYVKETDEVIMQKTNPLAEYLNFTATNGDATISMSGSSAPNVSYSFDKNTWTTWDYSNLTIPNGSTLYLKGNNSNGFNKQAYNAKYFNITETVEVNGNIMSLLYEDDFEDELTIPSKLCFYALFRDCTSIVSTENLLLPATTLTLNCYERMFVGCTSLTTSPSILPATTLTQYCYQYMFSGCTSLTTAPELPATTLANYCYVSMFNGCTSLVTAPELPATTLTNYCYSSMFSGCTNLNYIKAMFTTTPSGDFTSNWVSGVAATGTFVKNSAATWTKTGVHGVPTGWTIEYADA